MPRKTVKVPAEVFTEARAFLSRFSALDDAELDVCTIWGIGTWYFSPMTYWPATYPYLYLAGEAGAGKTVLGQDCLGGICRQWKSATGATGPTLFRMLGRENDDGIIENLAPTLAMDEIDATFSGTKDEPLRLSLDVGYKEGATIPRSAGKVSIDFPIYGPKILMGIENGHLPETVVSRSIRIGLRKRSQDELDALGIEPFFIFDVKDEIADMQQRLWDSAIQTSMVLRDYRPKPPKGFAARQWEVSRSLVQIAHALDVEERLIDSLITVYGRRHERSNAKQRLYQSIFNLFQELGVDRLTSRQIMERLMADGVSVPGNTMKGLAIVLLEDGVTADYIRMRPDHPGVIDSKLTARGYHRMRFDRPFLDYLPHDDDDDDC